MSTDSFMTVWGDIWRECFGTACKNINCQNAVEIFVTGKLDRFNPFVGSFYFYLSSRSRNEFIYFKVFII